MQWHEITDPADPELDRLATQYNLHPLHIEDCRHRDQNAKVEQLNDYLFVVLKSVQMNDECEIELGDVDLFVGPDYIISVQEKQCHAVAELMERVRSLKQPLRPDQVLYRVMDWLVDSYSPVLDRLSDHIDEMEDRALVETSTEMLQTIFGMKRAMIQLRRALANTRDVVGHLLRNEFPNIDPDLMPFLRDVYDHLVRSLDIIEVYRDLLTGATELYLSSVANRTNQIMKVLTIFGTIATPALIITGVYGMNLKHIPFAESPHSFAIVSGIVVATSVILVAVIKKFNWI